MNLNKRIEAFSELGNFLSQFTSKDFNKKEGVLNNDSFFELFAEAIHGAQHKNGWFLPEQVIFSVNQWSQALRRQALQQWTANYNFTVSDTKTVAIVMAGNIPLVGFHDLLSILISGHKALVKLSSNDTKLIPLLCDYVCSVAPEFKNFLQFTEGKLEYFDAVIATGSNNTARYFEHYFKGKPHIIRKNRNSVAVLTGEETTEQLEALGEDVFRYYGLGCRSVSKFFVPEGYSFDAFYKAIFKFQDILKHEKFTNNYDYNKAVYLMSNFKLLDNGFLMLKEDESYSSPISSVFYETYENYDDLKILFEEKDEQLQCIVNYPGNIKNVDFGKTQYPGLLDYADGVDTVNFLLKI